MRKPRAGGSLKAKYGMAPRRRYSKVIAVAKARYTCPRCGFKRIRKVSVGIWSCRKCSYIFAGGAYQPSTEMGEAARRAARRLSPTPQLSPEGQ